LEKIDDTGLLIMNLKSVQTYEINQNGVLNPVDGLVFNTDTSGTIVLGGKCNTIEYNNSSTYPLYKNTDAAGGWNPYGFYGTSASIAAGTENNIVDGILGMIGAGQGNLISGRTTVQYRRLDMYTDTRLSIGSSSFIGGGTCNTILSPKSVIVGGHGNYIEGNIRFCCSTPESPVNIAYPIEFSGEYQTGIDFFAPTSRLNGIHFGPGYNSIVGGRKNKIDGLFSFIGGGSNNKIESSDAPYFDFNLCQRSGQFSFIGGGCNNIICDTKLSSIVGGSSNCIHASDYSSMLGGNSNYICARIGFISNGWGNTVGGGQYNSIIGGCGQSMFGGTLNTISGAYSMGFSTILGGVCNFIHSPQEGYPGGLELSQNNSIIGGACNILGKGLTHVQKGFTARSAIINGYKNTLYGPSSNIIGSEFSCSSSSAVLILGGRNISGAHDYSSIIGDYDFNRRKTTAGELTLSLDFASGTYIKNKVIIQNDSQIPVNYTSFGISGQIAYDANYHYRHNGTNWTRTAMSIW
jgi:hypothetical protein